MEDPTPLLRLFIFGFAIVHLKTLLGNILQTYDTFNPRYIGYYLKQQCLQPLLGILIAILIWVLEDPILHWLIG